MDPVSLALGALVIVLSLVALTQRRRAQALAQRVHELEARLARPIEPPPSIDDDFDDEPEPLPPIDARADDQELELQAKPSAVEPTPVQAHEPEPVPEPAPTPVPPAEPEPAPIPIPPAEPEPAPIPIPKAAPDPRRLDALKIVAESFEMARYLGFDSIVEKPSTYRVTVPITAANSDAVHYLEPGMFACLKQVKVDDTNAILHLDLSKGPP